MFDFTFPTVYMAVITSNLLLIILTLCFRNTKLMVNVGYKLLALFVIFTILRFALPFEFAFTKTILLPEWISATFTWIQHTLFLIGEFKFSIWTVLQAIWLIGFVVKVIHYIRIHAQTRYFILANCLDATTKEPYQSLLAQICADKKKKNVFQVLTVSGIKVPLLYGIFKPWILIPEDLELTEEDLYYVLSHEAAHHFHHDLIIKTLIRFIDMIYWWNPFCRILVRQSGAILEMRIDNTITLSHGYTIKKYLTCLLQLAEYANEDSPVSDAVTIALFSKNEDSEDENSQMVKRFEMLAASLDKKKHFVNLLLLLSVVSIYLMSHFFILEPFYILPEVEESTMAPSSDSFYAILKEDNTYDIYYDDLLIENRDSLEYYPGIQVYTEKEYYNETH